MAERDIQHAILEALGADPRVRLLRNNVGVAEIHGRRVAYGVGGPGGSDLIGLLPAAGGRFIALEIKTDRGRVSPEQEQFIRAIRRNGGFAAVVRSVDDARAAVDRAIAGASE